MVATSPSMRSHSWSVVNNVVMRSPLALGAFLNSAFASSTFVSVGNEWHRRDHERQALAAHFGENFCADGSERDRQIAHRDRRIEDRAESARRHLADGVG